MKTTPPDPKRQKTIALLHAADAGTLDALECPECNAPAVSVRFTHPAESEYRIWFICSNCNFETRAQCTGRPTHFCESHIDKHLVAYAAKLLSKKRFPRPP